MRSGTQSSSWAWAQGLINIATGMVTDTHCQCNEHAELTLGIDTMLDQQGNRCRLAGAGRQMQQAPPMGPVAQPLGVLQTHV